MLIFKLCSQTGTNFSIKKSIEKYKRVARDWKEDDQHFNREYTWYLQLIYLLTSYFSFFLYK